MSNSVKLALTLQDDKALKLLVCNMRGADLKIGSRYISAKLSRNPIKYSLLTSKHCGNR